jgi:AcrR family transcriptional regulator
MLDRLTPAGRRILDVAADLFYRQGIHAVGVEAIASGAYVTKKTLYACFGSKDQLVAAYLTERDGRWREWLTEWVDRQHSAADKLLGTFDALGAWMRSPEFRGCGFVNAFAELPSADHPGHAVVLHQKQWMLDYFGQLARDADAADPEDLARTMMLLYEGVTVAASTGVPKAADQARKAAAALLASHAERP